MLKVRVEQDRDLRRPPRDLFLAAQGQGVAPPGDPRVDVGIGRVIHAIHPTVVAGLAGR
jgi:hypothetical protein